MLSLDNSFHEPVGCVRVSYRVGLGALVAVEGFAYFKPGDPRVLGEHAIFKTLL
jgi:hypothetical protein